MVTEQRGGEPGRSRATIADVARAAGVSVSAVSFAINGRPGIAESTRARILQVADEIGWKPSARARALAHSRANAVGLVLARPVELLAADPFFSQLLAGLEMTLSPADRALVLQVIAGDAQREINAYRQMADVGRVDGFVLTDVRRDDPRTPVLQELGLPVVVAGDSHTEGPFPAHGPDELTGTAAAVRHLLALGHRHIAYVSGPSAFVHAQRRTTAWRQTMEEASAAPRTEIEADFSAVGGAQATAQLLAGTSRPTAIVYANDLMAMAGLAVLRQHGLDVPRDVSVIGHDDVPLAVHSGPALTTVRQDVIGYGRVVAAHLLEAIDLVPVQVEPARPPELVIRETTAPPSGS